LAFTPYERDRAKPGNDCAWGGITSADWAVQCGDPLAVTSAIRTSLNRYSYVMNDPINRLHRPECIATTV